MSTFQDNKSGQEVAKQSGQATASRFHVDYWKARLYRKSFTRKGQRHVASEYSVRLQHLGRREAFALGSANAGVAAVKAKEIYTYLDANGWEQTLKQFKPRPDTKADICTLGDFLADVRSRSHLRPVTLRRYAVKLRKIVADVSKIDAGRNGKLMRKKYDYMNGGQREWRERVDGCSLGVLTPESINAWRNAYVAKAGTDPMRRKSAERSAASYLRCSRALFSHDVVCTLHVKVPENPFAGVKLKDPGPQRYQSDVNPELLLAAAERELREKRPQLYLALLLCLLAGLRRKEADLLLWEQIDFRECLIHIRRTAYFEPKTEESQRTIDVSRDALAVIRSFKRDSTSEFVLNGGEPNVAATYDYYRADCAWRDLNDWLRSKGVRQPKAIHSLRKESGSLIALHFGPEAARQHLGHRDIRTTSAHYLTKKRRTEVDLSVSATSTLKVV